MGLKQPFFFFFRPVKVGNEIHLLEMAPLIRGQVAKINKNIARTHSDRQLNKDTYALRMLDGENRVPAIVG